MEKILEGQLKFGDLDVPTSVLLRALILDDNPDDVKLCVYELEKAGFRVEADVVDSEATFSEKLRSGSYDVILSDFRLGTWTGVAAYRLVKESRKDIPFILVTGTLGQEAAVELIKEGFTDYILKDRLARLPVAVRRALQERLTRIGREEAIEALRVSEARLRRLIDSNVIGIATQTLDGKLLDGNDAFFACLGYSRQEFISGEFRWDDLTPPEHRGADLEAADQLKSRKIATPREKEFVRKDGSRVAVLIGVALLTTEQGDAETVSFVVDISDRKELEQQLRQAQKMEAIGQLAGGVAHDFNNLLSVIIGYSEILIEHSGEDLAMRSQCEEIKKAGDRAASLTRHLLAFSRQQVLEPIVLNLNAIVADTEKLLRRLIGEDIELQTILASALGSVKADSGQIQQIIMNLAVNARDAMPDGGKLSIETANVELDDRYSFQKPPIAAGRYVVLTVTDSGIGMNEPTKSRIFEPFFTTKEAGKGTGLGLSMVYGVVKQSGGHISVWSELGQGTIFKIFLPQIDEAVQLSPDRELAPDHLNGTETILLVEDEESVRKLIRNLLEQAGYKVIEASRGSDALEMCAGYPEAIDLLLTDVVMPGMNGPTLADNLRSTHRDLKVLCMSGYTGTFANFGAIVGAGVKLLQKPFSQKTLLRMVRETIDVRAEKRPITVTTSVD